MVGSLTFTHFVTTTCAQRDENWYKKRYLEIILLLKKNPLPAPKCSKATFTSLAFLEKKLWDLKQGMQYHNFTKYVLKWNSEVAQVLFYDT